MKYFNSKIVETLGFKAEKKGFFNEWRELTSSISLTQKLPYDTSAEMAYLKLKENGGK